MFLQWGGGHCCGVVLGPVVGSKAGPIPKCGLKECE